MMKFKNRTWDNKFIAKPVPAPDKLDSLLKIAL
jgi:hypothetical protein